MKTQILTTSFTLHHGQKVIWKGDAEKLLKDIALLEHRRNQTMKYAPTHTGTSDLNDGYELTALIELRNKLTRSL
jgi:hypothetical protein